MTTESTLAAKKERPADEHDFELAQIRKREEFRNTVGGFKRYVTEHLHAATLDKKIQASKDALGLGPRLLSGENPLLDEIDRVLHKESSPIIVRATYQRGGVYELTVSLSEKNTSLCRPEEVLEQRRHMELAAKEARWSRLSAFLMALVAELTKAGVLEMRGEEIG